jgi:phage gp46-like protein
MKKNTVTTDMKFPLELDDASPVEVDYFWESIPAIQLSTPRGWWGNALQPKNMQFGSQYAEVGPEGITIDRAFLSRKEALAVRACAPLVAMGIAKSVAAECTNPIADKIECVVDPDLTGVVPDTIVGGDYSLRFAVSPPPALVWQDTVDTGQEYQDTIDSGDEYQDGN